MAATIVVDTESLAKAVVQWVNTFDCLSRPCQSIEDLDSALLLSDILSEIDPQWFKVARGVDYGNNWVLKFNSLKKLHKLLMGYYEEVLGQNTAGLEIPNLTSIARDADVVEILKLAQLIIALAVQCENNQRYVKKIQSLDQECQHALMLAIETVMTRLANSAGIPMTPGTHRQSFFFDGEGDIATTLMFEKTQLEETNKNLSDELEDLRGQYEEVVEAKRELQTKLADMEHSISKLTEVGQVDFILRSEIDNLKADLAKNENRRLELEALVEKQTAVISDLTRKVEETSKKAEEADKLKDSLEEFRHMADKLQKSEAIIDKYKKRFEEVGDLRRQLRAAEEQNEQHASRNTNLEEEFRKVASIKPLVETLKEQLTSLERKNSSLQVENSTLEFQLTEARTKLETFDLERHNDQEHIQHLGDRLRELEFQTAGAQPLDEEISEFSESFLKTKVAQLEREVERLRADKASSQAIADKVITLENLLEDSNRLKAKFEHDYRVACEKNVGLENELKQLRSMSSIEGHRKRDSISSAISKPEQPTDLEPLQKQVKQLTEQLRQAMGKINKLEYEKDKLHHELTEAKNAALQHERIISDLRGDLAAMESRGQSSDESVQKIALITKQAVDAQNKTDYLHGALKEAKEHIRRLDEQLKKQAAMMPKDDNFTEAIASLQSTISEKEAEVLKLRNELADIRAAARKEQMLMASAWYNMVTDAQIKATAKLRVSAPDTPKSWLARERQKVLEAQTLRR